MEHAVTPWQDEKTTVGLCMYNVCSLEHIPCARALFSIALAHTTIDDLYLHNNIVIVLGCGIKPWNLVDGLTLINWEEPRGKVICQAYRSGNLMNVNLYTNMKLLFTKNNRGN